MQNVPSSGARTSELVDHIDMRKTDSFGETRLVSHIPSSHDLESVVIITIIVRRKTWV